MGRLPPVSARKPKVLFICHSASRNGATILLLQFLRWLRVNGDLDFEVLMMGRGPLLQQFQQVCSTTVWRDPRALGTILPGSLAARLLPALISAQLHLHLGRRQFDLIYANTAASWPLVDRLHQRAGGLVWHIHELAYGLSRSIDAARMHRLFPLAARWIAVSDAVRAALVEIGRVPYERIDVVHGFTEQVAADAATGSRVRRQLLASLGWPDDAFVVGGCGTLGWRKGTDLFLQTARTILREPGNERVRFLWVGGENGNADSLEFDHDVRSLSLAEVCRRIPSTADVASSYCTMDVFALTSREDPFPLVMLEAAACGLPIVCFEGSGGGPEFVEADFGCVVPFADVAALAESVITMRLQAERRKEMGNAAALRVNDRFRMARQAPLLRESIARCLETVRPGVRGLR